LTETPGAKFTDSIFRRLSGKPGQFRDDIARKRGEKEEAGFAGIGPITCYQGTLRSRPEAAGRRDIETDMRLGFFSAGTGLAALVAACALTTAAAAQTFALKPFKDGLFAYPAIMVSEGGDFYRMVDYRKERDIHIRDEVPERRVQPHYVSTGVRRAQDDIVLDTKAGKIRHFTVGKADGASIITMYLHGQGGSRKQGVDDITFGGNFNRIKNLMAANGGLYLSPDFSDFAERGSAEIKALLTHYIERSPSAPVFIGCGSMGGAVCYALAKDPVIGPRLGGLLLLGSFPDEEFLTSAAFRAKVPIFFGHGGADTVISINKQEGFFRSIATASPGYPTRFVRFETGSHGTPIRMIDWRSEINWMLAQPR
jgi:hypothetical protein